MTIKHINIFVLIILAISLYSCSAGGYSFTGTSISPNIKTVSIEYFPNRATLVMPNLSNMFTESLRDKFISQTNLEMISGDGDLMIEGEITNYDNQPQAIEGNETAARTRLTISVRVKFTNNFDPTKNFDTTISNFEDYPSGESPGDDIMQIICDKIIQDIFNRTVANW